MASTRRASRAGRTARDAGAITIGALSRATRIPVETLRTWERRYGSPAAMRKPSGHRLYEAETVERLRRVARLLALGHRPGEVLPLSRPALDRMLTLADPARWGTATGEVAASGAPTSGPLALPGHDLGAAAAAALAPLLAATRELDKDALVRELRVQWTRLGPLGCLETVAGPFLTEVGRRWAADELDVRHEHFAAQCVADFLREAGAPFEQVARGPRVVAATLAGDRHDGGLRMACALLEVRGYRVVYLGSDTPLAEIAAAARVGVEAVMVSVSSALTPRRAARELADLRAALPARMPIWLGGAGAPPAAGRGITRFASLAALDATLDH